MFRLYRDCSNDLTNNHHCLQESFCQQKNRFLPILVIDSLVVENQRLIGILVHKTSPTTAELLQAITMFHNLYIDVEMVLSSMASKQARVLHANGISCPGDTFKVLRTSAIKGENGKVRPMSKR